MEDNVQIETVEFKEELYQKNIAENDFSNSETDIPHPLSSMQSHNGSWDIKQTCTSDAEALIELSIMSATAASNEYPIDLVDSIRIGA